LLLSLTGDPTQARFDDQFTWFWSPHAKGLVHILRFHNYRFSGGSFETGLFGCAAATILLQSFANPDLHLEHYDYRQLERVFVGSASVQPDIRPWMLQIQISELMSECRATTAAGASLALLAREAIEIQNELQDINVQMYARLNGIASDDPCPKATRFHAAHQRAYGVSLAAIAVLLCVRRTLSPHDAQLPLTAAALCRDVLNIVEASKVYRPLAAVWTVHTLLCAWCCTADLAWKLEIEVALLDYQRDAMGPKATISLQQMRLLERRLLMIE
jgi:hypothetical protein